MKAAREGKPVEVLFTTSFDWPSSARSSTVVVAASGRYRLLLDGTHVGAGERGGASLAVPAPSGSGVHRLTVGVFHAEGAAALRLRMTFPEMKGVEGVVTDPTWMTGDDAEKEFRERGSSDGARHPATLLTSSPLSALSFSISRNGT